MNTDVVKISIGHEILENMVVVFVAYIPPLALLFTDALPHPVVTIVIIITGRLLLYKHLTARLSTNLV